MEKDFCRDRFFPTTHIEDLPKQFLLGNGSNASKSLIIDYTTKDQLNVCREIMDDASQRGDNVGIGEFNPNDDRTKFLFDVSEIFHCLDPDTGRIEVFMFIQSCLYQRSFDSTSATVHIFRSTRIDDTIYAQLASLMGEFARALNIGYTHVCTQVALCLSGLYTELRRQGFLTVAVMPEWVEINGIGVGENALLVKQIDFTERKVKSDDEVKKAIGLLVTPEVVLQEFTNKKLPEIPGLPTTRITPTGNRFLFRCARKDDDEDLFRIFCHSMEHGEGFSVHEIPSLDFLRVGTLASGYTIVIEEEGSREISGMIILQDSYQYRRAEISVCDPTIVLKKELRGMRIGTDLQELIAQIGLSLGYERDIRTAFVNNGAALGAWKLSGAKVMGVIPLGGYLKGIGWVDVALGMLDYRKYCLQSKSNSVNTTRIFKL